MKNRINFTKITWALVALLIPAITHAHTAADSGLLHELFHNEFHMLGGAGLLAVLAVGVWLYTTVDVLSGRWLSSVLLLQQQVWL